MLFQLFLIIYSSFGIVYDSFWAIWHVWGSGYHRDIPAVPWYTWLKIDVPPKHQKPTLNLKEMPEPSDFFPTNVAYYCEM